MPLDFPNTSTTGTVYTGTNNVIYIFDGVRWNGNNTGNLIPAANLTYDLGSTSTQWRNLYVGNAYVNGQPVGSVTTGTTAPTGGLGKLWYNPDAGRLYIYYDSYWVDASPPIGSSGGSIDLTAVSTNVLPASDLTYNLGSSTKQWRSLYVGTSTIYIGGSALSVSTSGSLTVNGSQITASFATTSGYATSFNTSTLVNSAVYASTASGNFTVPGDLNINGGTIYNNGYALSTATSFNTSTLVTSAVSATTASFATTSGYATSFNTSTLVTSAVSATTASWATTASYAQSFNTSTLVSSAVSAANIVNGTWTLALSATGQLSLPSSLKFPDNSVQTTAWTPSNVSQDVTFSGNVTFNSSSTYVLSTNTVYTDNIIELHYTSTWAVNDGKDIGLRFHYYDTQDRNAFFGRDNTTGYLEWLVNSSADNINNVTGTNGTFRLGSIILTDITASSSTATGALQVAGGVGIGGGLYVGGISTFTNIAVHTNLTGSTSTTTGALTVAGGVGIGGGVYVGGTVTATTFTGLASAGTTATTAAALGYLGMPQNSTASSYTLVAGDQGKHIYVTATGQTITVPANSTTAFPVGTTIAIIAGPSATSSSIAITTDTMYLGGTGTTGTRTLAAYGMATLVKVATTTWFINGSGLT